MADVVSSEPSKSPRLPIEICEYIPDMVAVHCGGNQNEFLVTHREARKDLNACRLVCRAWVPRCRLHLYDEIFVDSPDILRTTAAFLSRSDFHANQVRSLRIRGGGPSQSWISTVPLRLPRLRRLAVIILYKVDFSQQPPHFYQIFSLLRARSESTIFDVYVDGQDNLKTKPARIKSLAAALRSWSIGVTPMRPFPVQSPDMAMVKSWPRRLTSCLTIETRTTLQDLLRALRTWTCPTKSWRIIVQCTLPEKLRELSRASRRLWAEFSRVFALSRAAQPCVNIEFYVEGFAEFKLGWIKDSNPVKYGLWVDLDNANDDGLAYVALVIPCLTRCSLTSICISAKKNWSTSTQAWDSLDKACLRLNQHTPFRMTIMAHPTAEIPTWEMLPYECWFKFCMYMLPKCTTEKILQFCSRQQCSLHDPQRWHLQTQGTVQELLATLLSWTCPVKLWTITLQNSLAESLEGLSHETQKLWEELARVFSLSLVARPGDVHIDIHVEGLGEIVLSWVTNSNPVQYILWADLDNANDQTLSYLARVLSWLASCNFSVIRIQVKNQWSTNPQSWKIVDEAILLRSRDPSLPRVSMGLRGTTDVPSWDNLPYDLMDDFRSAMLPKCATKGLIIWCAARCCHLRDLRRQEALLKDGSGVEQGQRGT